MIEDVWFPTNHAGKGSFAAMEVRNIADYDGDQGSGIWCVCSLFLNLPIYVEDGNRKHFLSLANNPILRRSVPREVMVVDDVAHFWWEIKNSKRLPFRTSHRSAHEIVNALMAARIYSAPQIKKTKIAKMTTYNKMSWRNRGKMIASRALLWSTRLLQRRNMNLH